MDKEKLVEAIEGAIADNLKIVRGDFGVDNDHQFYTGKLCAYREFLAFVKAQRD